MFNLILVISYLGCLSSNQMLSMLLLLVLSYMAASMWFISNGIIYTGLLYILVYVGAIVVLIMFVVQLTNTSLSGDGSTNTNYFVLIQNSILIFSVFIIFIWGNSNLDLNSIVNLGGDFNLSNKTLNSNILAEIGLENQLNTIKNNNNLSTLANSIFNEYGFILIISVHAIVLAVIGPIKLALTSTN